MHSHTHAGGTADCQLALTHEAEDLVTESNPSAELLLSTRNALCFFLHFKVLITVDILLDLC